MLKRERPVALTQIIKLVKSMENYIQDIQDCSNPHGIATSTT